MNDHLIDEIAAMIHDDTGADEIKSHATAVSIADMLDDDRKANRKKINPRLDINYYDGRLSLNLWELIERLDEDEKNDLAKDFAWSSPAWEEMCRAVRKDTSGECYNPDLYRMRLNFLQSEDAPRQTRKVIEELMRLIVWAKKREEVAWNAFQEVRQWWREKYETDNFPFKAERAEMPSINAEHVIEFMKNYGIELGEK